MFSFLSLLLLISPLYAFENMNGEYILTNTANQKSNNNWSTHFKDYPGGVEYFEFYTGPVTSTYSEVFWTPLPEVNLSAALIQRFKNKAMAVVGIEADQVRRTKDGDVSVPINVAYNHHYGFNLLSSGASMQHVPTPPIGTDKITSHPGPNPGYSYVPVEHTPNKNGLATSIVLGYSNGGEFRKTYHGLAPPFAQIIGSPTHVSVVPMQIDTWNRDKMNLTGHSSFVPGIAPKNSYAPTTGVDAIYSGLLECPLTTRIRKTFTGGGWNDSVTVNVEPCSSTKSFNTTKQCFDAAPSISGINTNKITTKTMHTPSFPSGCSLSYDATTESSVVSFNTYVNSTTSCGSNTTVIVGETMTNNGTTKIHVSLNKMKKEIVITMTGPKNVWYGCGFDTISMSNSPYAIVVDGNTGDVSEHVLGNHMAGTKLQNTSVTIVSNTVVEDVRTVVMTRALKGITTQHHTFDPNKLLTNIISAYGTTTSLSYHKSKETAALHLWPLSSSSSTCVCSLPAAPFGKGTGTLTYLPSGETIGFPFRCNVDVDESVLHDRNPTCDIRTYLGGLSTCHHAWHLIDADQEVPWPDQKLEYWMKFRIYFQDHDPLALLGMVGHHIETFDITWSIAGATGEYDVPQCKAGTPTEECKHEITGIIVPPGDDLHFVAAHYHCHAPTCLSIEIWTWNNVTNTTMDLLCKEEPYHGQGKINGDTGDKFDEEGYIAVPICMWGIHPPFEKPPLVSGVPLFVKATTNNTYGHHGEMALPQMLLAHM